MDSPHNQDEFGEFKTKKSGKKGVIHYHTIKKESRNQGTSIKVQEEEREERAHIHTYSVSRQILEKEEGGRGLHVLHQHTISMSSGACKKRKGLETITTRFVGDA